MSKWFWAVLGLGVAILIGIFVIAGTNKDTQDSPARDPKVIAEQDHVRGNASAKVTIMEYGDFQCPACGNFYPIAKKAEATYGKKLRFVFRHFPISSIHPNAYAAARAAEAAGAQGKFFAMHDLLYERQQDWAKNTRVAVLFEEYAAQLGLDVARFKQDYNSDATANIINGDIKMGQAQSIEATPGLLLNNQKIENPRSFEVLKTKIDELLKAS